MMMMMMMIHLRVILWKEEECYCDKEYERTKRGLVDQTELTASIEN